MASGLYNRGKFELGTGGTVWTTSDIRVLLVGTSFTFDPDHNVVGDISGEISTDNYARQAIGSPAVTENDTNDRVEYDLDDVLFESLGPGSGGPTVRGIVIYRHVTNDADSPLLGHCEFAEDRTVNGENFTAQIPAAGAFQLS